MGDRYAGSSGDAAVFELDEEQSNAEFYYDYDCEYDDDDGDGGGLVLEDDEDLLGGVGIPDVREEALLAAAAGGGGSSNSVPNQQSGLLKSTSCSDLTEADAV